MKESGVEVFETGQLLLKRMQETGEPQYLKTDTHWTPPAMEATAHALAAVVTGTLGGVASAQSRASVSVSAHGDTVGLLGLPEQQTLFPQQTVSVHPVFAANSLWKASPEAEVLLLGDSFTNIYSLEPMGWGSGAGFGEHLSAAMGRPLDVIARNSDGAFATRQALQRELAAGRDRLSGKKIVIWEFAARELAFGDWRLLSMSLGSRENTGFYSPPKGGRVRVEGTVAKMSQIPRPGSVPYREHIVSIQLVDARPEDAQDSPPRECLVYTWSMKDQSLTPAARLRPGDRIAAVVQFWEDVAETYEKFQRSELDDPALLAEPFNWSDGIESPARLP
jgi:alginate O-acetyltransferase complex protein AlgJ